GVEGGYGRLTDLMPTFSWRLSGSEPILIRLSARTRRHTHGAAKSGRRPVAAPHPILAHHLYQHAFAQSPVGHPQSLTREGAADGVENGATGKHEGGPRGTDASIGHAIFVAQGQQAFDHARHLIIDHPAAVDPATLVTPQLEMDAGDRRDRARGAEQVDVAVAEPAMLGHETLDQGRNLRNH